MKRTSFLVMLILALVVPFSTAGARSVYPEVIPLQDGFQPEGIAVGYGHTFFTGSLNGGAIFRGDLRDGEVEMISSPGAKMAVGMDFDERSGYLFVAGGAFGTAYIYDGSTGEMVASYQLTPSASRFVNDVIVTRQAAYFTDSFQKQFYRLPLGPAGDLPQQAEIETVMLGAGFDFIPGAFNANGIVASQNGKSLIIVNAGAGKLYKVNPLTGEALPIMLANGDVASGDGLVLRGHTLYVVQNFLNRIAVVHLDPDFETGMVNHYLTSSYFRVPTTAAIFGDALYAVNARFDEIPAGAPAPTDNFEAVRVEIE